MTTRNDVSPDDTADRLPELTVGTLLGGRVRYTQFLDGYRTGLEPVLMAAAIPARRGQRIIEAGCGAGAGLMCVAARAPEISGVGVEMEAATAALARQNFSDNGLESLRALCADVTARELLSDADCGFDHAFANPPWHRAHSTLAPDLRRRAARSESATNTLEGWIKALARVLRHGGSLTLALPAASLTRSLAAMSAHQIGSVAVLPLWPHRNEAARLIIVQGRKAGRGDSRLLPGLVLHEDDGSFTTAAQAILRHGEILPM